MGAKGPTSSGTAERQISPVTCPGDITVRRGAITRPSKPQTSEPGRGQNQGLIKRRTSWQTNNEITNGRSRQSKPFNTAQSNINYTTDSYSLIPMETPTKELGSLTRPNPLMEAPTLIPNNFTDATTSTGEIGKKTHGRLNAGRKPRSGIGTAKPP